jgi:cobalamin biosynthesis Co2+ chelatase CbiK
VKKFTLFWIACVVGPLMLIACDRAQGVFAGNDENQYQPRLSPTGKFYKKNSEDSVEGELIRVDLPAKTIGVRIENGIVQTFRFDESTTVAGLDKDTVRNLVGKEGSEVMVRWKDLGEPKMAKHVDVKQIALAKQSRRHRRN